MWRTFFERRQNCRTPAKNLCRGAPATKGGMCFLSVRDIRKKLHKSLRQSFAWRCANLRRKMARRLCFALPRCDCDKVEAETILSLAWQKCRFARSGLGSEACMPARLRRPVQVCRSGCAQNRVAFGNNTTTACRQDGMPCTACIDGIVIILAARLFRSCYLEGTSFFAIMPNAPLLLFGRRFIFVLHSLQKYARVRCGRRGSFCLRLGLRLTIMRPLWYGEERLRRPERNCDDTRRLRLLLCLPPTCDYSYACVSSRRAAAAL